MRILLLFGLAIITAVSFTSCNCEDVNLHNTSCALEDNCAVSRICVTSCGKGSQYYDSEKREWSTCSAPGPYKNGCCPGVINSKCPCAEGQVRECRNDVKGFIDQHGNPIDCGIGTESCLEGQWGDCLFLGVEEEICDNHDNDCENGVDQFSERCDDPEVSSCGACRFADRRCTRGVWSECSGAIYPKTEDCRNGIDDDCDCIVDNPENPHDAVDIVFVIDSSVSMEDEIIAFRNALRVYASEFDGSNHRFGLVRFSGTQDRHDIDLVIPLSDPFIFRGRIALFAAYGGSSEYSYDALHMVMDPRNPLEINWRDNAFPYVVLITDEEARKLDPYHDEDTCAVLASNCRLPGCAYPDKIETFIITQSLYWLQYDAITYFDSRRLLEIFPATEEHFINLLHQVFVNMCVGE